MFSEYLKLLQTKVFRTTEYNPKLRIQYAYGLHDTLYTDFFYPTIIILPLATLIPFIAETTFHGWTSNAWFEL